MKNHVMIVDRAEANKMQHGIGNIVMRAGATVESGQPVQKGSLMYFHRRFGHLNLDTIKRLARTPSSGIKLTDNEGMHCSICA